VAILIEAAIDSAAAAERAVLEGADRLEVCADLDVGGLTPSLELLVDCLALGVPCVAMARPRAGNFRYDDAERRELERSVTELCRAGAHGVVFGALTSDSAVDAEAAQSIVRLCSGKDTVFHRAFDRTANAHVALATLISCGVTRVLTSGHSPTAAEGIDTLVALSAQAAGRVQILPGGGVRAHNVVDIVRRTRVAQIHARGTEPGVIAAMRDALRAAKC